MSNFYEDQTVLSEYLLFHYGAPELVMPWAFGPKDSIGFPEEIAKRFNTFYPKKPGESMIEQGSKLRALDVGCAVGRSSFELSRWFTEVIGLDFSNAFIQKANEIKEKGSLEFQYRIQGNQFGNTSLQLPNELDPSRVQFRQGDAMMIKEMELGEFDLILASNLICRLPDPAKFLRSISGLLKKDGVFVISTPFTYLEAFTEATKWVGGTKNGPSAEHAFYDLLSERMHFLEQDDIPMLIREHKRKYQWTVCNVSVWKMKA